jgi:5-methylcytosine-specific restriction enzyme A
MRTYLLTWNPRKCEWATLREQIVEVAGTGGSADRWSCGSNRGIGPGDRVFLLRQGEEPRGIVASGRVTGAVYRDVHWGDEGRATNYIDLEWDELFDPARDAILPREDLDHGILSRMHWNARQSGTLIPEDVAAVLEGEWERVVRRNAEQERGEG